MPDTIIRVENLGKKYVIPHGGAKRSDTFRDALMNGMRSAARRLRHPLTPSANGSSREEFWGLKDVSFEVKRGDVVGIIGRNGAGKSTLLKILSRITEPTTGRVAINGRVASLLEVGTGFHPELSGRENIYLNGAILGMNRGEIARKFDEIVAFAEVEKFLDTAVKHYSSGMYLRLAFAVAAHLEPEILVVDEVLAVGDYEFQKKCLGKMQDVAQAGRTVLFVSHNLVAVSQLCNWSLLLESGQLLKKGQTDELIREYYQIGHRRSLLNSDSRKNAISSDCARIDAVRACTPEGQVSFGFYCRQSIKIEMDFICFKPGQLTPSFHILSEAGILVFTSANYHESWAERTYATGSYRCSCLIPSPLLNAGTYYVHAYVSRLHDGHPYAHIPEAVSFEIIDDETLRGKFVHPFTGVLRLSLSWTMANLDSPALVLANIG